MAEANHCGGRILRLAAVVLLTFFVSVVVSATALTLRGEDELKESDSQFHAGNNYEAITHAKKAALAYVPGSRHVREAHERLETIARGAESAGDLHLARVAWDALRLSFVQTAYPGRAANPAEERALTNLARLSRAQSPEAFRP